MLQTASTPLSMCRPFGYNYTRVRWLNITIALGRGAEPALLPAEGQMKPTQQASPVHGERVQLS